MPQAKSNRRYVDSGEALAMHRKAIKRDERGAFFFLMGPPPLPGNEYIGGAAIVHIRGPIEQFDEGTGDSYEAIRARVLEAMTHEEEPVSCVVLRMASPGGVVSGLWETVRKLRAMSREYSLPIYAYVDELAASAAYALACACEEIYLPESGCVGSIGVISHMFSVARQNDEDGVDVEVIASGDQKADGNENLPITDDAKSREFARVMKLARQFYGIVSDARGVSTDDVQDYEAGVFIGDDGVNASLADGVMGWDEFLGHVRSVHGGEADGVGVQSRSRTAGGGRALPQTTRILKNDLAVQAHGRSVLTQEEEDSEMLQLQALINEVKKDLAHATGKRRVELQSKLARLSASLTDLKAYKKTKYVKEEETSEEDAPEEESEDDDKDEDAESDDEDKDAEGDDDKKDAAHDEKKKESRRSRRSEDDAESEESDEDAEDDEKKKDAEDEKSEDEALAALTGHLKGKAKQRALGFLSALVDKATAFDRIQPQVAHLKATEEHRKRSALIDEALKGRRITKKHARDLREKPLAFVKDFLKMHTKALYFTSDDADLPRDAMTGDLLYGEHGNVPSEVMSIIDASVAVRAPNDPKKQEELRSASVKAWRESQNGARH
jgi:ClpP class serine protease